MEISRVNQGGATLHQNQLDVNTKEVTAKMREKASLPDPVEVKALSKEDAKKAVDVFNEIMKSSASHLQFTYHEKLQEYYVAIVDDRTKEVIREIPPKKLLDMVASIREYLGLIIDRKI